MTATPVTSRVHPRLMMFAASSGASLFQGMWLLSLCSRFPSTATDCRCPATARAHPPGWWVNLDRYAGHPIDGPVQAHHHRRLHQPLH